MPRFLAVPAAVLLLAAPSVRAEPARSSLGVGATVPPACSIDTLSDRAIGPAGRRAPAPRLPRIACSAGHAPRVAVMPASAAPGGPRIVFVTLTY